MIACRPSASAPIGRSAYWRGLIRQLIGLGVLDIDTEGHGGLFLVADKARPILRGEQSVTLREAGVARPRRGRGTSAWRTPHGRAR